jgi:hypothetical protein
MFDKQEFWLHLMGPGSIAQFFAAIIFALVGAAFTLLAGTVNRDPASPRSPVKFSIGFLLSDNSRRIAASIIAVLLALRFSREIFGSELTMYFAVGIGMTCDIIVIVFKNLKKRTPIGNA